MEVLPAVTLEVWWKGTRVNRSWPARYAHWQGQKKIFSGKSESLSESSKLRRAANSDWDQETAELLVGDPGAQGAIPAKVVSDLRWG